MGEAKAEQQSSPSIKKVIDFDKGNADQVGQERSLELEGISSNIESPLPLHPTTATASCPGHPIPPHPMSGSVLSPGSCGGCQSVMTNISHGEASYLHVSVSIDNLQVQMG
ncbi:hypothetical protein CB1_000642073 [Camelus ferus]|nr:hypothetical protein CB1_000642073 [Camelus ferus]